MLRWRCRHRHLARRQQEGIDQDIRALIEKMQTFTPGVAIETNGDHAFSASVALVSNGVMLGAALMYRILNGGAR